MASTDRRSPRDLIAEIRNDGPRFRFFQAVRLLSLSAPTGPGSISAHVRFGTPLSLSFPASEIIDATAHPDDIAHDADHHALRLTVGFMGLTGPSGTLPTAYTELLIERRNYFRDTAAHQFLDLFSHRALSLFYQAWRKHRFYLGVEAGEQDGFTRNTLDFVGVGLKALQDRLKREGGIPDMFLSHFAGLLAQKPISGASLAALIRGYFKVDAEIEQFVGQWVLVPGAEQTQIGMQACVLGESAFAGTRLWDRQHKIHVRLGPLTQEQFADFLPGQAGASALAELMQFCVGRSLACDLTLVLQKEHVPRAQFTETMHAPLMLGHNTWLRRNDPHTHPDDACFNLLN